METDIPKDNQVRSSIKCIVLKFEEAYQKVPSVLLLIDV